MYLRPALSSEYIRPARSAAVLCFVALSHAGGENGASSAITERALFAMLEACENGSLL